MAEDGSRYKGVFPDAATMLEGSGVAVHVGTGIAKKVWHLPEKLLKSKSAFFTAALEGGFAEGIPKSITLPADNSDIFKYFVEWLYVGDDRIVAIDSYSLVCLWILGDRLRCPLMQDDAICNLASHYRGDYINEDTLKSIYEGSAPGFKLRRFAVDQCLFHVRQSVPAHGRHPSSYMRFMKDNEDFAHQLAEATILRGSEKSSSPYHDKSRYLLHYPASLHPSRGARDITQYTV